MSDSVLLAEWIPGCRLLNRCGKRKEEQRKDHKQQYRPSRNLYFLDDLIKIKSQLTVQ